MRRFVAGLALAVLLAACGQADMSAPSTTNMAAPEEAAAPPSIEGYASGRAAMGGAVAQDAVSAEAPAPSPPPPPGPGQPQPPASGGTNSPVLYLAYTYGKEFEIPSEHLISVMDRHVQACQAAGPRLCQLIGTNRTGDPESAIQGYVSLRGEPAWLRTFMGGMEAQVDEAGGRIVTDTTTTEDLTRQIVDTEARLRAQTTLRDRLQELLRSSRGRLADLLEVERELARVQGEIDAVQSNLAVMRTRVAMSELTLNYHSAPRSVGSNTFEPLNNAFANFLGIIVGGFAVIITLIAGLIPFAIVIVPIVWLILRWRRNRGGRLFGAAKPAAEKPADSV